MQISTKTMLRILLIISWIIFVGLCIQAGGFLVNTIFTMVLKPEGAKYFWKEVDLDALYVYDPGHFLAESVYMIIVAVLKASLLYLIIKILHEKKLNLDRPFNKDVGRFIFKISCLAFGIGLFSFWGANYTAWLVKKGVEMPDLQALHLSGADVWLFMAITLFVVAQIFKRGIEIQTENELTV